MKSNLRILFRISGGRAPKKELGIGHVVRCLNLASLLKKSNVFFLLEDYGGIRKIFQRKKYSNIKFLQKNISVKSDIEKTKKLIKKNKIDVVIVDKYKINFEYVSQLKEIVTTVVISDLQENNYKADLIVNGFIGNENKIQHNKFKTKCLFGPSFQIINSKFQEKKHYIKKFDILATFGGFDEKNIIEKLLNILNSRNVKIKTKIILGPATPKTFIIKKFIKKKYSWLRIVNETNNMYKEISESKYGLCSGGLTTYEMASLNIPFGIICQNDHQLITAKKWEKLNYGLNLELATDFNSKKFEEFIKKISRKKITNKKIIDGCGAQRVIKEIIKIHRNNTKKKLVK